MSYRFRQSGIARPGFLIRGMVVLQVLMLCFAHKILHTLL